MQENWWSKLAVALAAAVFGGIVTYFLTIKLEAERQRSIRLEPSVSVQDYIGLRDEPSISKGDFTFTYKNTPITQLWKVRAAIANPGKEIEQKGHVVFSLIPAKGDEIRVFGKTLSLPGGQAATDSDFDKVEKPKDRSSANKERQEIVVEISRLRSSSRDEVGKDAFVLELTVASSIKPSYCLAASIPGALMSSLGDSVNVCPKD